MRHSIALLITWWTATLGQSAVAESAWVSDQFRVPVRSGPSSQHRIVHRGIPSGTELVVLDVDDDANFTHVRTVGGTEGWLPSQYIVDEPIARLRLAETEIDLRAARAEVATLREQLANVPRTTGEVTPGHDELLRLNARLRDEVGDLIDDNRALEQAATRDALLIGAALVLVGLVIGVLIRSRTRQRGWS